MAPVLVVLVVERQFYWAVGVFAFAGLTDLLDGVAARASAQTTRLGAMLDPMADKVLLSSSFVALTWGTELHVSIPLWLSVVTLSRDAIILVSVAIINLTLGIRVFYPSILGKLSTASQLLTAGIVILANALGQSFAGLFYIYVLTLVLTVASALHYVYLASSHRVAEPS